MSSRLQLAELEHEWRRLTRVAAAYNGTPLAASYEKKAQIAKWKLELAESEQGGTDHEQRKQLP